MSSPPAIPSTSMLSSSPMKGFNYYFPDNEYPLHGTQFQLHEHFDAFPLQQPVKIESVEDQFENQENLFPAMHVFHTVPQSNSTQSMDSLPFMSTSNSEQSIGSSFHVTPSRTRRLSATLTPMTQIYESPNKHQRLTPSTTYKTPSRTPRVKLHRRTKSRLSLDASGCASIVSETRSPGSGTNPFYTAFMSPYQHTPLQTPNADDAVSPNVLMSQAPVSLSHAHSRSHPLRSLSMQSLSHSHSFGDPLGKPFSDCSSQLLPTKDTNQPSRQQLLTRSQSSIDLASIVHCPPPEITKFDILEPRRKKITRVPSDKKTHSCPLCGGVFQRPEHVKRHMRSHSSEKPFDCDECGKKFNRADNLRAHLRKIHGKQH